jgi:hypothetical protein
MTMDPILAVCRKLPTIVNQFGSLHIATPPLLAAIPSLAAATLAREIAIITGRASVIVENE